ncbi:hypothetical protein [Vibrio crassostreae]|uniref:hypothetical protein n=1 Tax=Vibrio crassostreae TaxID=246167 RepID=UPI000F47C6C3|nr:hypothetical protein [Vibrio crassostreae]ROQ74300.1 hypothetical protein EDB72_3801 [Vibrio crassostreae]
MARSKERSNKAMLDAIERIVSGTYTSQDLKKQKVVRLNDKNVQIEAGLTLGAIRHHPDIKKRIVDINNARNELDKVSELQTKVDKLKKENTKLKAENAALNLKIKRDADSWEEKLASHHQAITALFFKIPLADREEAIKTIDMSNKDNVTNINAKTRK